VAVIRRLLSSGQGHDGHLGQGNKNLAHELVFSSLVSVGDIGVPDRDVELAVRNLVFLGSESKGLVELGVE